MFQFGVVIKAVPLESIVALDEGKAQTSGASFHASVHTQLHTQYKMDFWSSSFKTECSLGNCNFNLNLFIHYILCILPLDYP